MKKILTILILLISINSFSQEQQYEKVRGLYSNAKYEEAIPIIKDLLDNKYGKPAEISVFYLSYWIADSYKNIENYSQAIDKFNDYIEFINASDIFNEKTKKKLIKPVLIIIEELKFKMVNSKKTEISSDTEIVVDTKADESKTPLNEIISTQDAEETVTLVVNSQGETVSDAKQNALSDVVDQTVVTVVTVSTGKSRSEAIKFALRDALEQTYGTFISSNTEILNDELIKDEIVSISSGNIVDYEVLSESELSNSSYSVSVRSRVSLTSFASFMQNKGDEVSFSGKSFGMKIKLQNLNARSEEKAIDNMIVVLRDIIKKCVDFEIAEISEPVLVGEDDSTNELYNIIISVKPTINDNYDSFKKFFLETLKSIAMSDTEIEEYARVNKKTYSFFAFDEEGLSLNIKELNKHTKMSGNNRGVINEDGFFLLNNYRTRFNILKDAGVSTGWSKTMAIKLEKHRFTLLPVLLKFRSKESIKKIDILLQKNQFHFFNFSLKYGNDEYSPTLGGTNKKHLFHYQRPIMGFPSAYSSWGDSDLINLYTHDNSYSIGLSRTVSYFKNPELYVSSNDHSGVIRGLIFTDILPFNPRTESVNKNRLRYLTNDPSQQFPPLNHIIIFQFTLDELEKIDEFKLINLN